MAADVGVKMGVSGIASFKSAMNSAKSSVKALDAELKLNAAQYRASGDAEEYMAGRTRILADQIKSQEQVVANAEKALSAMAAQGVDKASASYTQMQAALAKAKTDLLQMQQAAGETGEELEKVAGTSDKTADSLKSIDKGVRFQNLTSALDRIERKLGSILQAAVRVGQSFWNWGREAAAWGDELATDATKYGLDAETLQRYRAAAKEINTSVEDIIKAQDKLTKSTANAEEGIALITTDAGQYGIAVRDAAGDMRDQMDVLWDFVELLGTIDNETERNVLAQEYFGKSYRELIPLIEAGREGWEAAAAEASTVTQENIDKLTALDDKLDALDQRWETTRMTLLANLAPAFEKIADALTRVMDKIDAWAESEEGQAAIGRIGDAVADLITNLADGDFFERMFEGAVSAVEKIADFLEKVTGDDIINGLKIIAGIIGGIKLADATVKGLSLMHSLGLIGNKNGGVNVNPTSTDNGGGSGRPGLIGSLVRIGEGYATSAIIGSVLEAMGAPKEEANAWAIASGIATLINPVAGASVFGLGMLTGGHTANDEAVWGSQEIGKINGRGISIVKDWRGLNFEPTDAVTSKGVKSNTLDWAPINYDRNYMDFYGALNNLSEGITPMDTVYGYLQFANEAAGAIVAIDEAGELYFQYFEHIDEAVQQLRDELAGVDIPEETEDAGANLSEALATGAGENADALTDAGSELSAAFEEGIMANLAAAFGAGAQLAAAFASGAGAGGGAGSSTTNYNSNNVNQLNVYGVQNPAQITEAVRRYMQTQQAGYGG